ncbi:UNKNOWN [Stylonychia lemnae]|uniref:Peroxin-13 n=1 Tax=Stylonychia lemnae TaxID=5949 RepID=A0A078AKR0_STYLE|nr:UNKNOWN [Stylonychia lemnae]|eukprot:CDW82960.1 UNKNOWN [Stylonychia lemnae]
MGNSYGGFGGSYGGMNSMYGNNMGGMMNNMNPEQMQQQNGPNPNGQQQQEYQFDLRRDMRDTIGGLNASLGLAYGVSQMANLGTIGIKYLFKALKWLFKKVFNTNNIIAPIKFLLKLILGRDIFRGSRQAQMQVQSLDYLEKIWQTTNNQQQNPNPRDPLLPRKIFGMSINLVKSLVLALVGVGIQLVLFLMKRGKARRLEEIEKQEVEERKRQLEQEWLAAQEESDPELVILRGLEESKIAMNFDNSIQAYDGELTSMTFNHVKSSKAFKNKIDIVDESDLSWLGTTASSSINISDIDQQSLLKSEDGWQKRRAISNAKKVEFSSISNQQQ